MPDPSLLTPNGLAYLAALPAFLREDQDAIAVAHACGREQDLLEERIAQTAANLLPGTADALTLPIWEALFGLSAGTQSDADREAALQARARVTAGGGQDWIAAVTNLIGPGWSFERHVPEAGGVGAGVETIIVSVSYSPSSDEYHRLELFLEFITDANTQVVLRSSTGFTLDFSQLDAQTL